MPALLTRMSTPSSSASAFAPSALTSSRLERLAGKIFDPVAETRSQRLELFDLGAVQADDRALRVQDFGDRLANAAGSACHECLAAGQFEHFCLQARAHPSHGRGRLQFKCGQSRFDIRRRADRGGGDVAVDAARQARKHFSGAYFIKCGHAVGAEPLDGLAPAHPARHLLDQPPDDLVGVAQRLHRDVGDDRHRPAPVLGSLRQRLAHRVGRRRHQGRMERRGHLQHQRALGALVGAELRGALDGGLFA